MTDDLVPAYIADDLLRERLDLIALGQEVYAHWLGGAHLDALAGTTIPGGISIGPFPMPPDPELPMLDLSWRPPDPVTILEEILEEIGLMPEPMSRREWIAALHDALGFPQDDVTQELRAITEEES